MDDVHAIAVCLGYYVSGELLHVIDSIDVNKNDFLALGREANQ